MLTETLKELCALPGVSSCEDAVRDYIRAITAPYADRSYTDTLGNLIIEKKGVSPGTKKVMLAAHMDEVGLMVHTITEDGYLKFRPVGGIDRRVLLGKPVLVGKQKLPGVIGLKAYHLTSGEEARSIPKLTEFYIDIGADSREEALRHVSPGDIVCFDTDILEFGHGFLKAKAIDDRIGCTVMKEPLPMDCTFVFTVQEEVGTRGAFGAAFSVTPDIALILEGTTAADLPEMESHQKVCLPGKGPVVPYMDGGTVYDRELFELLRTLAERGHIPWQTKEFLSGGTDASAIQRTKEGVRVAAISAAVRYLHPPVSLPWRTARTSSFWPAAFYRP